MRSAVYICGYRTEDVDRQCQCSMSVGGGLVYRDGAGLCHGKGTIEGCVSLAGGHAVDYRLETHGVQSGQDTGRKAAYQCGISNEAGSDEETLQMKVQ